MLLQNLTLLFSGSGGEYLGSPFGEFPLSFSFSVVLFTPALCSQLCHLLYFLSPSTLFSFGFFTPHSHVPFCLSSSAHHSISSMFGYGTKPTRMGQNFKGGGRLVWGDVLIYLLLPFFGCFFLKKSFRPLWRQHASTGQAETQILIFFVRKLCEVHCHPSLSGEQLAAALHFCAHVMHAY